MKASTICAGALLVVSLAGGHAEAADAGRQLYVLTCMGCHPLQEDNGVGFRAAGRYTAEFRQSPKKREFFIHVPAAGHKLSGAEDRELVAEIATWAKACPQLPPDALQNRPEVEKSK